MSVRPGRPGVRESLGVSAASSFPAVRLLDEPCIALGDREAVGVTRVQDQRVLARLALAAGTTVSTDELISVVWDGDAPRSARRSLQNVVVRLRRALGVDGVVTEPEGYRIATAIWVDLLAIGELVTQAEERLATGRWGECAARLREALEGWDLTFPWAGDHPYWTAVRARWVERRAGALEDLLTCGLLGDAFDDLETIEQLVRRTDPNERLVALWALNLHRGGRPSSAEKELAGFRRRIEARGLEVSPMWRALEGRLSGTPPELAPDLLVELDRPQRGGPVVSFVGRRAESALLEHAATRAAARSQVVTIVGPAGIGKSAFLDRFLDDQDEHLVLLGRALPETSSPYDPIVEALSPLFTEAHADILRAHLALHGGQLVRLVPPERWPVEGQLIPPVFGEAHPDVLHDALASLLELVLARRPVVFAVEDVHWLAPSAIEFLRYLVTRRASVGLLVVLTSRPGREVELVLDRGVEHTQIAVGPLEDDEIAELLRDVAMPGPLVEQLTRLSGGQPLLVRQLLADATARGGLQGTEGELLAGVVRRRLEMLGAGARDVAQVLALAGRVDEAVVDRVLDPRRDRPVGEVMADLESAGLVRAGGPPYEFDHDLLRTAIVADIPPIRRAFLHHRLARVLCEAPDPSPSIVARHLLGAAQQGFGLGEAAPWLLRAAEDLVASLAFQEAEDAYRQYLVLAESSPIGSSSRIEVEIALGRLLGRLDRWDEAEAILGPVWDTAIAEGRTRLAAQAALGLAGASLLGRDRFDHRPEDRLHRSLTLLGADDGDLRSSIHLRLGFHASARGDAAAVARHVSQALADAEMTRDPNVVGAALGGVLALQSPHLDLDLHRERARRIVETGRLLGEQSLTVTGLIHEATAVLMGGADPGLERFSRLTNLLVQEHKEPFARPALPLLAFLRGDLPGAERALRDHLAELQGRPGFTDLRMGLFSQLIAVLRIQDRLQDLGVTPEVRSGSEQTGIVKLGVAHALVEAGDRENARPLAREVVDEVDGLLARMPAGVLFVLGELSNMVVALGEPDLASIVRRRLEPHADLNCSAWMHVFGGSVSYHLGRLAVVAGAFAEARDWLEHALRRHESMRALPYVARSHLALAELELQDPHGSRTRAGDEAGVAATLARVSGFAQVEREIAQLGL